MSGQGKLRVRDNVRNQDLDRPVLRLGTPLHALGALARAGAVTLSARGVDRTERKHCPGQRAGGRARQGQAHRCVARRSDATATQRGRPGHRRWLASLPHRAGSSGLQRRHGDAEGDRWRRPGRGRIQGMRRKPGVQPLTPRPGSGWLDSAGKDLGVADGVRAVRAQPAAARRTGLPPPPHREYEVLRLPRVPQQHAQHRPVRHHLLA